MRLVRLQVENFRNLEPGTVVWDGGLNLVLGGNGEGKSNLLEAVTVLGNLRSFRSVSWSAVVRHGASWFRLEGEVVSLGGRRRLEQTFELGPPQRRQLLVDGREVEVAEYLQCCPVFALSGSDGLLVDGGPEVRRAFVDRMAFLLRPGHLARLRNYRRALRQRNAGLASGAGDSEMSAWEAVLSDAAAKVVDSRAHAVARLQPAFAALYHRLGRPSFPAVELRYVVERRDVEAVSPPDLAVWYRSRFEERRTADRRHGFTGEGPHRHDLRVEVNGRGARGVLSAGQVRTVAAALRLAALAEVEAERSELLPTVLDDADAELDAVALEQLLGALADDRQLFLSSAHGDLGRGLSAGQTLWVRAGGCTGRAASGDVV